MLLAGKAGIVAGVGPGLGREIALALAREGAAVALGARTQKVIDEVAEEVRAIGGRAVAVATDVTDPAQCEALVATAIEELGRIDHLVHNATAAGDALPFERAPIEDWRPIVETNVFGALHMCRAVIPRMRAQHSGSIVLVNSTVVRRPVAGSAALAASKGGLLLAAHVLAKEVGPDGIRVNSVVPGVLLGDEPAPPSCAVEERLRREMPPPPAGAPSAADCANAVVFFASDLAAIVTGQSLDVNGGAFFH